MSRDADYKGYTIKSRPLERRDDKKWTLAIFIAWQHGGTFTERHFTAGSVYTTEQEADLHGISYGQRIIDGMVPGCSVE